MLDLASPRGLLVSFGAAVAAVTALLPSRGALPPSYPMLDRVGEAAGKLHDLDGWHPVAMFEESSSKNARIGGRSRTVRLPDDSLALVRIDRQGEPRALVLPDVNAVSGKRDRALTVGGSLAEDRSVHLPGVTDDGETIDFMIRPDGVALATTSRTAARND